MREKAAHHKGTRELTPCGSEGVVDTLEHKVDPSSSSSSRCYNSGAAGSVRRGVHMRLEVMHVRREAAWSPAREAARPTRLCRPPPPHLQHILHYT